ncbi:hypothetical protein NDU88_004912 [Pleurodeles waltl]|uniref:Uncharacterized protein n=1 Tax=Pleurodeles waltl TaxID=8319 RepID=A0AAV7QD96_PLEWA|nr:hypothetical protein NDU88_004912 [Pleurodeles waltl]
MKELIIDGAIIYDGQKVVSLVLREDTYQFGDNMAGRTTGGRDGKCRVEEGEPGKEEKRREDEERDSEWDALRREDVP